MLFAYVIGYALRLDSAMDVLKRAYPNWTVSQPAAEELSDGRAIRFTITTERIQNNGQQALSAQQRGAGETSRPPQKLRTIKLKDEVVLLDAKVSDAAQVTFSSDPESRGQMVVFLGTSAAMRWLACADYGQLKSIRTAGKLIGGDDPIQLAIRAVNLNSVGASEAREDLIRWKDRAIPALEEAAMIKPWEVVTVLGAMHSHASIQALIRLQTNPSSRPAAEQALYGPTFFAEAKPLYLGGLKDGVAPVLGADAGAHFGWKEFTNPVRTALAKAATPDNAIALYGDLQRLLGREEPPAWSRVRNYYRGWTSADERAVLHAKNRDYAVEIALSMLGMATKGGRPFAKQGLSLLTALRARGDGPRITKLATRFNFTHLMDVVQREQR